MRLSAPCNHPQVDVSTKPPTYLGVLPTAGIVTPGAADITLGPDGKLYLAQDKGGCRAVWWGGEKAALLPSTHARHATVQGVVSLFVELSPPLAMALLFGMSGQRMHAPQSLVAAVALLQGRQGRLCSTGLLSNEARRSLAVTGPPLRPAPTHAEVFEITLAPDGITPTGISRKGTNTVVMAGAFCTSTSAFATENSQNHKIVGIAPGPIQRQNAVDLTPSTTSGFSGAATVPNCHGP